MKWGLKDLTNKLFQKSDIARNVFFLGVGTFTALFATETVLAQLVLNVRQKTESSRTLSHKKDYQYKIDSNYFVTLKERSDENRTVYEISVIVKDDPKLFGQIRDIGIIMDGNNILEDYAIVAYKTLKKDIWMSSKGKKGSDELFRRIGNEKLKAWLPPVAIAATALEGLYAFFDWSDAKRRNNVYPRQITEGEMFFVPVDIIREEMNLSRFIGEGINGVKFIIPIKGHEANNFFIKFVAGQYSAVPTASKEFGIEILADRENPMVYSQKRGNISLEREVQQDSPSYVAKDFLNGFYRDGLIKTKKYLAGEMLYRYNSVLNEKGEKGILDMMKDFNNNIKHIEVISEKIGVKSYSDEFKVGYRVGSKILRKEDFAKVDIKLVDKRNKVSFEYLHMVNLSGGWHIYRGTTE